MSSAEQGNQGSGNSSEVPKNREKALNTAAYGDGSKLADLERKNPGLIGKLEKFTKLAREAIEDKDADGSIKAENIRKLPDDEQGLNCKALKVEIDENSNTVGILENAILRARERLEVIKSEEASRKKLLEREEKLSITDEEIPE